MNGTNKGYFQSSRGLRQGNPLCPYLFIIAEEVRSRLPNKSATNGKIMGYKTHRGCPHISNLFYADDLILFKWL